MTLRRLADIYPRYAGEDCLHGCDKGTIHDYIAVYDDLLAPYQMSARRVLEVGIMGGASLRMWEDYFGVGARDVEVWGADLCEQPLGLADLRPLITEGTHRIALMNAEDGPSVERYFAGMMFDVIIEDAGHDLSQQVAIYRNLRHHLSPGGIYVIEDVADLDRDRAVFEALAPDRGVRIVDRRAVKGRFDDVLVVIGGCGGGHP